MFPEFLGQGDDTESVAQQADTGTAADLLRRGQVAARNGEWMHAARLLRAVLIADPANVQARLWLAAIVEDPQESVQLLTEVLQDHPDDARAAAGLHWACGRLEAQMAGQGITPEALPLQTLPPLSASTKQHPIVGVAIGILCLVVVLAGVLLIADQKRTKASRPDHPTPVAPASLNVPDLEQLPPVQSIDPYSDLLLAMDDEMLAAAL